MREMTESNLLAAFAGESQAHMKYVIFAEQARKEGFPNIARLFEAIAYAERVHATNHLRALGQVKSSGDNLQVAIEGENFEVAEMYPAYDAVAHLQEEKGAQRSIHYALEAEKIHAGLFAQAKSAIGSGQDIAAGPVQICEVCGHTVMGDAPDRCPVCNVPKSRFKRF
jgi:rubrerythrin